MTVVVGLQAPARDAGLAPVIASAAALLGGWGLGLFWVGSDTDQGEVYRILFVHVPSAWAAFIWVFAGAWSALRVLRARGDDAARHDNASHASMELGTLYAALALVTGSIWGRPTWGVWWDWDPRLTSTLVLFLLCCGTLLLRQFTPEPQARRRVAAITSLLTAVNVPIVYFSVNLWRSLHQPQTFVARKSTASADISLVLWINVALMLLFSWTLYRSRKRGIAAAEALAAAREAA